MPDSSHSKFLIASVLIQLVLAACAGSPATSVPGLEIEDGLLVERYAGGLQGPTQMILGPDGRIWLGQLAGSESEGTGQVIALDRDDPTQQEVLLQGLFKPTGIAVLDGALWIAAGRDLLRAELDSQGIPSAPEPVLEGLPFNGRSNGTLTVTPEGRLLYETSGSRRGDRAAEGSASLWSLDQANPLAPRLIANGLKNAYAHTYDEQGRLWVTEVGDDPVNGEPPPDELNLIVTGADYGWPACYGKQEPAGNYGGTGAACAETQPAVVLFAPRSTPTSVVASPWQANVLLVALWGPTEPSVVQVHLTENDDRVTADEVSPFLTGLAHPQSLLLLPDDSLLVSDFQSGQLYRIRQP